MNFIATIKFDSDLDCSLKSTHCQNIVLYSNRFILTKNIYICYNIINLVPLLDNSDIEIVVTNINLVDSFK